MPVPDVVEPTGLEPFHPVVQTWFREAFSEPTEAQRRAWLPIAAGQNTLLLAPTDQARRWRPFWWPWIV